MDDLISRQGAINKCRKRLYESAVNNVGYKCDADKVFVDIAENRIETWLNELPYAQSERRWIPISERLPEDYTDVLVWFEYFRYGDYNCLYQTYGIGDYIANYGWMINHETGWHKLRVIAWMPLPEPYTQE